MAGSQNIGEASDNPVAINVTAMVDVIFCLCLFFMCSLHFKQLQGKIETWLPKDRGIFQGEASSLVKDEIAIVMRWDPTSRSTVSNIRFQKPAASEDELMLAVRAIADDYDRAGNTTYPLIIDAQPDVPWQDVVHIMDLCKRNNIQRIEFAAPERPIE
jgi:biopolymer transport protein ExbD